MIERATGLVLRARPLTETSLIVNWLTSNLGRLATVAKGARGPKSPFRGKLDLFYLADFTFTRGRTTDLHKLREVSVRETHPFLRRDMGYLQQASYCVRLIEIATESETPLVNLFQMLSGFLQELPAQPPQAPLLFSFELKLLRELGLQPDPSESRLSPGGRALIRHLEHTDWKDTRHLRISPAQQTELRHFLHGFLLFHLGRVPKGRDAALGLGMDKVKSD
jgi:DNA repair protein RecO (recombination protein O)